jgi:hypothetical protein
MNIALKEWQAVIAALDRGAQIFLLRKGGIVESRRGFEPRYAEFLFFPTTEHQHARYLKQEWAEWLAHTAAPPDASLKISHLGQVTDVLRAPRDHTTLLAAPHVWNEDFIRQRYSYRPDLALYLLVVRIFRLATPRTIPIRPAYAGCKSWVHLTEEVPVEATEPALAEAEFAERRQRLLAQLGVTLDVGEGVEQTAE